MRKIVCLFLCAALMATAGFCAASAGSARADAEAFRLSGVSDVTGSDGVRTYRVYAPYTDTYSLSSADASSIAVYENGTVLAQGSDSLTVDLTENTVYTLEVKTPQADTPFSVAAEAQKHLVTLPYDVADPIDTSAFSLEGDGTDPLAAAEVRYQKRSGGTYIYSNNPEGIRAGMVGNAFLRNENLTGEVFFTFEHANYSGAPVYLGYRLKNDGDSDVFITVTNIGYQTSGSWYGQLAWYDFYNVSFALPDDYFTSPDKYYENYAFKEYTPRVFQPITYRLPAGEAFYVIGGTSGDAYRQISVDGTADQPIETSKCANGNVKFIVTGGSVTGTFYAYDDAAQVLAEPEPLGYVVTEEYARQYGGKADHAGVIDNYITWTFSDRTVGRALPATYTNRYADQLPADAAPYEAYESTLHTVNGTNWTTHLNPQNDHKAVGMDMVAFTCVDGNGNEIVIDNDHADGAGKPANTGNWMIEYQDHFTFVNQGDADREVTLSMRDNGTLAVLARDSDTGEILRADLTGGIGRSSPSYLYTVSVPAHSVRQITLEYVLLANSYGGVVHSASLSRASAVKKPDGGESSAPDAATPDVSGDPAADGDGKPSGKSTLRLILAIEIPLAVILVAAALAVLYLKKRRKSSN